VPDRDPVAGYDANSEQSMGEVGCGVVELGPGQPAVRRVAAEVDVGRLVRRCGGVACDALGQGGIGPPAGSPVLRGLGTRDGGRIDAHDEIIWIAVLATPTTDCLTGMASEIVGERLTHES
jgi:hypothetical protein